MRDIGGFFTIDSRCTDNVVYSVGCAVKQGQGTGGMCTQ